MYLYMFLLLLSCRASSYFIPSKEMPFLQKINKTTIIEEIICLLDSANTSSNEFLKTPINLTEKFLLMKTTDCAHENTDKFIKGLKELNLSMCMIAVSKEMKELENICSVLKKKTTHENSCNTVEADFAKFKTNLERFLKWVNETLMCNSTVRNEVDLYVKNCTCPRLRRYPKRWP